MFFVIFSVTRFQAWLPSFEFLYHVTVRKRSSSAGAGRKIGGSEGARSIRTKFSKIPVQISVRAGHNKTTIQS